MINDSRDKASMWPVQGPNKADRLTHRTFDGSNHAYSKAPQPFRTASELNVYSLFVRALRPR